MLHNTELKCVEPLLTVSWKVYNTSACAHKQVVERIFETDIKTTQWIQTRKLPTSGILLHMQLKTEYNSLPKWYYAILKCIYIWELRIWISESRQKGNTLHTSAISPLCFSFCRYAQCTHKVPKIARKFWILVLFYAIYDYCFELLHNYYLY